MRKTNKLLAFAIVFAMVVSTMVMPVSVSAADNLCPLGSFEQYTTSEELQSVVIGYDSNRTYTLMTDGYGANGTNNYVRITDSTWAEGNFQTPVYTVEAGKTYRATVYLKSVSGTITTPTVQLRQSGGTTAASSAQITVSDTVWTKVTVDYTIPENAEKLNLGILIRDVDKNPIYVDEVSIVEYIPNLIANGEFDELSDVSALNLCAGVTATLATDVYHGDSGKSVLVSGRTAGSDFCLPGGVALTSGQSYKFSYWAKLPSGSADTTAQAAWQQTAGGGITFKGEAVTLTDDAWTYVELNFKADDTIRNCWDFKPHLRAFVDSTVDYYIDDVVLTPIATPALTTTTSIANGATVDVNTEITYTFSDVVKNFSGVIANPSLGNSSNYSPADQQFTDLANANFVLAGGAGNVAVTKINDKQYTVALSGLAYDTDYTLTVTPTNAFNGAAEGTNLVRDYCGNAVTSVLTFTTEEEPVVVVPDNLAESAAVGVSGGTLTTNDDGSYTITGRGSISNYGRAVNINVEAGKKYLAVVSIKRVAGSAAAGSAYIYAELGGQSANNIAIQYKTNQDAINDDWQKIAAVITVTSVANPTSTDSRIHFGVRTGDTNDYMFKDFELREISETLDLDTNYLVKKVDSSMYLHNPSMIGQNIYVFAVDYNTDGSFAGATMVTDWFNENEVGIYELPEADKYFIWNAAQQPLCTPFSLN